MPKFFTPKHRSHVSGSRFTRKALIARLERLQKRQDAIMGRKTGRADDVNGEEREEKPESR